jgi:glycosyltransferase involved in cell wall biosynthesis
MDNKIGICINPSDKDEALRAVEWFKTHPQEAEFMGNRGKELVEEIFNWDKEFIKLLSLYLQLQKK